MFLPLGFELRSVMTSLGKMVYYTAEGELWQTKDTDVTEDLPSLLFLHGFGGGSSAYEWSKVYPAFADEYRIVAPDLIGWGYSHHPQRNYQIDDYLQNITEFIEKTCTEPVAVVASSLTAGLLIRLAVVNPHLFKCLILIAPSGLADFGENSVSNFFTQLISIPGVNSLIYNLGIANKSAIRSFLEERQFANSNRVSEEIVEAYAESASQPNAEYAALSFVRGDLSFDLSLYISQLNIPTTFIWGQESQFTKPEMGKRLADLNPQSVRYFEQLENVGLTPQLEVPAVTIGLIRKFLRLLNGN
ncbi:alpha/beta hydrolase [Phormidium sp. LEGE 05292]|uniref:alpha/beta fold hydrolase n=1 Tax=[Phormidium] sp. LEGE 05292 TaxID=767427 RepID=UPI0018808350|nr:alpha/beta hydrolase [Phormidium sp. LEGE 05292]MBE9228471.1 alpha/beta hydrolase [Phormidium sp. LEGE 05292]